MRFVRRALPMPLQLLLSAIFFGWRQTVFSSSLKDDFGLGQCITSVVLEDNLWIAMCDLVALVSNLANNLGSF